MRSGLLPRKITSCIRRLREESEDTVHLIYAAGFICGGNSFIFFHPTLRYHHQNLKMSSVYIKRSRPRSLVLPTERCLPNKMVRAYLFYFRQEKYSHSLSASCRRRAYKQINTSHLATGYSLRTRDTRVARSGHHQAHHPCAPWWCEAHKRLSLSHEETLDVFIVFLRIVICDTV